MQPNSLAFRAEQSAQWAMLAALMMAAVIMFMVEIPTPLWFGEGVKENR